jgi:hypothetical protein
LVIAREYGFASWPRLKAAIDTARGADVAGRADATRALATVVGGQVGVAGGSSLEAVRLLLAAGADPGRAHPGEPAPTGLLPGRTLNPLPLAAAGDRLEVVAALLAAGADPDAVGRDGLSALRTAIRHGRGDLAAVLVRYGAVHDSTPTDRLLGACVQADRVAAERLLAEHPDLAGGLDALDQAMLVDAAEYRGAAPVALMLDVGFPIGAVRPVDGATALHAAAYTGRAEVVGLLLARGADLDGPDRQWGATALAWASVGSGERPRHAPDGDWPATVRLLVDAGARRAGAWVAGKPPNDEVAAVLAGYGIGEPDEQPPPVPAPATPATRTVAAALRAAFDTADEQALAALLHPDVRWGGGPAGCHSRAQVLEWYQVLHARGVHATVRETTIVGDTVILGLAVSQSGRPPANGGDLFYQAFTVADGAVVEIRDATRPETG